MEIIDAQIHEPHIGGSLRARIPDDIVIDERTETWINVELAREAIDCLGLQGVATLALVALHQAFFGHDREHL